MLFDRFKLFVDIAKYQNLAQTARSIHVSPSSVSQRLKCLEKDFGAKLYNKKKDGIELTNAGRVLLSTANQVLYQLDTLRKTLNPDSEKAVQTLSVGGTYNPSARCLPSAIATFQKTHPDIKVTFLTSSSHTVEKWVRDGEVDIAMIQSPSESCIADLFTEHFAADKLVFFAHAGHPLTKIRKISFEDLADTPLIVREGRGTTRKVLNLLRSRGLKLNIALRCDSPDGVNAAVRRKMGLGISFHNLIEEDVRRNDVKVVNIAGLPRLIGNSYITYDKARPLTAPATEFLALLRDMKPRQRKRVHIRESMGTDAS